MHQAARALEVTDLSHNFGETKALDHVSFDIAPGAFTVLLGLNGAGKTTLFSLISRLYNNKSGSIRIFGLDLRRAPLQALARIGIVFQSPTLDLDLTVGQNLTYHAALHALPPAVARRRIAEELGRIGIADRIRNKVRELSGGQRRRVEIARALLHSPRLLLLDEPTVGLDVGARKAIVEHVRSLCAEQGLAVLWATHLFDEVAPDDQVVVLHKGRKLAFDQVKAVFAKTGEATMGGAFTKLIGSV